MYKEKPGEGGWSMHAPGSSRRARSGCPRQEGAGVGRQTDLERELAFAQQVAACDREVIFGE